VTLRDAMPIVAGEPVSRPLQPLLHRDHLARGKTLLALPVLPQRHQLGRRLHRPHGGIELLLAVAVTVDEHRQVARRERRLLPRDRVQRDSRIGDDLFAILARDPQMIVGPLGILAALQAPRSRRPDLVLGFQIDPLRLQCPVIDPRVDIQLG
jgi:hypothetical protein